MYWLAAVAIALTSNIDNLAAGLSLGLRSTRISITSNFIIAIISMLSTDLSMYLGHSIARLIPTSLIDMLGGLVIATIGFITILGSRHKFKMTLKVSNMRISTWIGRILKNQPNQEPKHNETVSLRDTLLLGIALSCNNVATGVAAGASGISMLVTSVLVGIFSLILVGAGSKLGSTAAMRLFGRFAPLIAGILLVGVGLNIVAR